MKMTVIEIENDRVDSCERKTLGFVNAAPERQSDVDKYGFERGEDFDYESYEEFMSEYLAVLTRRLVKWEKLLKSEDGVNRSRKVKRYVRKGIPSDLRTSMWMNISSAQKLKEGNPGGYDRHLKEPNIDTKVLDSIKTDIHRTFPENVFFREQSDTLLDSLSNVLIAFASINKKIGYCQGLNYIVGMLLLQTRSECDAFWLLVVLLEHFVPDYYSSRMLALRVDCHVLESLISIGHPDLHDHFKKHNIDMELFVSKWFVCLFMDVLPTETTLRLWDCLFYEGSKILLRAAYTLIVMNKAKFLELTDFTKLCNLFKEIIVDKSALDCHQFLKQCFIQPKGFSKAKIKKLREKHTARLSSS